MIEEWYLERFKSIVSAQRLLMQPLTVFAGANSSGKSTVLQSMLLLAQTLSSKVERRQLLLNGDLVRLGALDDVLSHGSSDRTMTIGFRTRPSPRLLRSPRGPRRPFVHQVLWSPEFGSLDHTVCAKLQFGGVAESPEPTQKRPVELVSASVEVYSAIEEEQSKREAKHSQLFGQFSIGRRSAAELRRLLNSAEVGGNAEIFGAALKYNISLPGVPRNVYLKHYGGPVGYLDEVVGTTLDHFLPETLLTRHYLLDETVFEKMRYYATATPRARDDIVANWRNDEDPVVRAVGDYIRDHEGSSARRQAQLSIFDPDNWGSVVDAVQSRVEDHAVAERQSFRFAPPTELVTAASAAIATEFGFLRYLGPLRDPPRPLYELGSGSDARDVGTRGEFTAAVLDLHANTLVEYVDPRDGRGTIQAVTLQTAVLAWLRYFEIADMYETEDAGSLGHRLYVIPSGVDRRVDLTNVGVGVSQLLPIVVMALISERGAVLLFEQPELHLHPRVQSMLGDFFVAVTASGRQCIVETHSEYLVNRLRLRVAESGPGALLGESILLYFVERREGESHFRPIRINSFGAIPEWPDGFFDQGPRESDAIALAALAKRKMLRNQ